MQENLNNMEKFFKYNLKIKNLLYKNATKEEYRYDKEFLIDYSDKLESAINDIEYYMENILNDFNFPKDDKIYLKKYIKAIKQLLLKSGYEYNNLKKFYEICFSNMDKQFVNEVRSNIFGVYFFSGVSLSKAKSLNEMLHLIHQTIINNENNFRNLPIVEQKQNVEGNLVTVYGKESELAKNIFNVFPYEFLSGFVEIMSLSNDRIILMIRDYGHALSIEIEKENDKYYIHYFIPKICNVDMINNLRGVNKVTKESKYTVGVFDTNFEKLPYELMDFISKVPTDDDLVFQTEQSKTL